MDRLVTFRVISHPTTLLAIVLIAAAGAILADAGPPTVGSSEAGTGVTQLTGSDAEHWLTAPGPNGNLPCGLFDTGGHGPKVITLIDYPQCVGVELTIFCLDGEGQWHSETISDLSVTPIIRELRFYSHQHGTCGIFPADINGP